MDQTPDVAALSPTVVAARIKAERLRLGLTQQIVAERLGVGRKSYSQLEVEANPQALRLVALAEIGFQIATILPELFPAPFHRETAGTAPPPAERS